MRSLMREKKQLNVEIGERIKQAREKKRYTQEWLAEQIEVSPQYVSDLERGVVGASLATFRCICLSLGVSSDTLLFGRQEENDLSHIDGCCRRLPKKQFRLLEEIISNYVKAVTTEGD